MCLCLRSHQQLSSYGDWVRVSSDRLEEPKIDLVSIIYPSFPLAEAAVRFKAMGFLL